ncbi:hypothetical protein Anapl_02319, partial [Anas platyrhynchos]
VQFTQVCLPSPPPPHHTGPTCVPIAPMPPESSFAAPAPFPWLWSDRKALRYSSYHDMVL